MGATFRSLARYRIPVLSWFRRLYKHFSYYYQHDCRTKKYRPDLNTFVRLLPTATKLQTLFLVRFPFALPYLISAMKMSITLAMIGVIVNEFITSQEGLGFLILVAFGKLETDLMLASVLFLCAVGLFFYSIIAFASYRLEIWFGNKK